MSEENKEEKLKPWSDIIRYEFDTARRKEKIYKETLKWLETNEEVQDYFKGFNPATIAMTINSYAWQKAGWMVNKERTAWLAEHEALKYKNEAEACLGNIQQKKLFDKQCLWRAEQFKHTAVEITNDFYYWEYNVLNCPFIDPVTQEDIALYIEFLETYVGENLSFLGSWQDYNTYNSDRPTISKLVNKPRKEDVDEEEDAGEAEEKGSLMPPWYEFCYTRRGGSEYLLLPDLRQAKESSYAGIAHKEQTEIWTEKFKVDPPDTRPSLSLYGEEKIMDFIDEFEKDSKEVMDAYRVHLKGNSVNEMDDMFAVENAWYRLSDCHEPFPIATGFTDWKEALIVTARQWENKKVAKMLPVVYDEYLFRVQCGIAHPYDTKQAALYRKMADDQKAKIIRGREMKGEPLDLKF